MINRAKRYIKEYLLSIHKRNLGSRHKWNALETAISFNITNNIVGDYLEFGVFQGASFIHSYKYYKRLFSRYQSMNQGKISDFLSQKTRFFAFDSFEGLPTNSDKDIPLHWKGSKVMRCTRKDFINNLKRAKLNLNDVEIVEGFYDSSLNDNVLKERNLKRAAIVNIDCDLYESTVKVLDFLSPILIDGTVIYFDDWFYYSGHPQKGERGAFEEWLSWHPEFKATELCKYFPAVSYIIHLSA